MSSRSPTSQQPQKQQSFDTSAHLSSCEQRAACTGVVLGDSVEQEALCVGVSACVSLCVSTVNMLKRLPVLEGFPVDAVPRAPYPNDSDFYNTVR